MTSYSALSTSIPSREKQTQRVLLTIKDNTAPILNLPSTIISTNNSPFYQTHTRAKNLGNRYENTLPNPSPLNQTFTGPTLDSLLAIELTRRSHQCSSCKSAYFSSIYDHLASHNIPLIHPSTVYSLSSKRSARGRELATSQKEIAYHHPLSTQSLTVDPDILLFTKLSQDGRYTDIWRPYPETRFAVEGVFSHLDFARGRDFADFTAFHWARFVRFVQRPCSCPDMVVAKRYVDTVSDPRARMGVWARYHIFRHIFFVYSADDVVV